MVQIQKKNQWIYLVGLYNAKKKIQRFFTDLKVPFENNQKKETSER